MTWLFFYIYYTYIQALATDQDVMKSVPSSTSSVRSSPGTSPMFPYWTQLHWARQLLSVRCDGEWTDCIQGNEGARHYSVQHCDNIYTQSGNVDICKTLRTKRCVLYCAIAPVLSWLEAGGSCSWVHSSGAISLLTSLCLHNGKQVDSARLGIMVYVSPLRWLMGSPIPRFSIDGSQCNNKNPRVQSGTNPF